jgi:hypothetical protein
MPYTQEQARAEIAQLVANVRANEPNLADAPEAQIEDTYLRRLFHYLNWNTDNDDRMVQLVDSMLALHRHKAAAQTQAEQDVVQRQINATDQTIDRLVYELYGLTEAEARVVEGRT